MKINVDRMILSHEKESRFDKCMVCNCKILRHDQTEDGHISCLNCHRMCFCIHRDIKLVSMFNREYEIEIR